MNELTTNLQNELTAMSATWFSGTANTPEEKKALFNATSNPENKIKDFINTPIKVKDVFIEVIEVTNEETGEASNAPRVILIDDKGVGYSCVSIGVYNTLKRLFTMCGTPDTWDKPLTVVPKLITRGDRNILTLAVK